MLIVDTIYHLYFDAPIISGGKLTGGGRGEELAKEQKIDYRTIGQRIKDKVMGRGGNKFDTNSLRYKFGTLRGLATTTGLVTRGSGGIIDSMLARREERKQGASTLMKLNPQMQNLSQFGGSEDLARGYFESKVAEYESKFAAIDNTIKDSDKNVSDKFTAISALVEAIATEEVAPIDKPKNVLFNKADKSKAWETYLQSKKS